MQQRPRVPGIPGGAVNHYLLPIIGEKPARAMRQQAVSALLANVATSQYCWLQRGGSLAYKRVKQRCKALRTR